MLRVTIEIVPFGIEERVEVIGTIKIGNINTTEDNRADYRYSIWDKNTEKCVDGNINNHQREDGAWDLIRKILSKSKKEGVI